MSRRRRSLLQKKKKQQGGLPSPVAASPPEEPLPEETTPAEEPSARPEEQPDPEPDPEVRPEPPPAAAAPESPHDEVDEDSERPASASFEPLSLPVDQAAVEASFAAAREPPEDLAEEPPEDLAEEPSEDLNEEPSDPHSVKEVVETGYVETGTAQNDTTDDSWGGSVWDAQPARRKVREAPLLERHTTAPEAAEGTDSEVTEDQEPEPPQAESGPPGFEPTPPAAPARPEPSPPADPPAREDYPEVTPPSYHDEPEVLPTPGTPAGFDIDQEDSSYEDYGDQMGLDDFFESQLFGEEPPTEEVPTAFHEDVSPQHGAPMKVPEPPPLPGILDRYTPAQVPRSAATSHQASDRPSYLPTPEPQPRTVKPPAAASPDYDDFDDDDDEFDDEEAQAARPLIGLRPVIIAVAAGGGFAVILVLLLAILAAMGVFGWRTQPPKAPPVPVPTPHVQTSATTAGGVAPAVDVGIEVEGPDASLTPLAPPSTATPPLAPPLTPPTTATPTQPPTATPTIVRSAPEATPAPAPEPVNTLIAPTVDANLGTLKIRSNRRVLVMVNGNPVGYPPLDLPKEPGLYRVSASLPGRPDTQQNQQVNLEAGSTSAVEFSF